jgi:hypothetical protein
LKENQSSERRQFWVGVEGRPRCLRLDMSHGGEVGGRSAAWVWFFCVW